MTAPGPTLLLLRHGETEWSRDRKHTGRTDVDLTPAGVDQAEALRPFFDRERPDVVLTSPMRRARRTAELAGLTPYEIDDDLREWDYGDYEGITTEEIRRSVPGWSIWDGPWPGGETAEQVGERADRVIRRVLRAGSGTRVGLVAHGHLLRALAARWVDQPVRMGGVLALDTSTVSELGWEHANRVVRRWNTPA